MPESALSAPTIAREVARDLRGLPGVVSVTWGTPRRNGEWRPGPALVVHVRWKHRPRYRDDRIPRRRRGVEIDVIEVGLARTLADGRFDHADHVTAAAAPADRRSTLTVLQHSADGVDALVSGHGALRLSAHGFSAVVGDPVAIVDGTLGRAMGALVSGKVGRGYDFAYVRFPNDVPTRWVPWHHAAGRPPLVLRSTPLELGERLGHYSRLGDRRLIWGTYRGDVLHDVELRDAHAGLVNLGALRLVEGNRFALAGDSGSLVVDADHRAVGVVVGGSADDAWGYVMSLVGARFLDARLFDRFFREAS